MKNFNKYRRGLPDNTASDTSPYCIPIPNDPQYRVAFFGAILRLGQAHIWDIEETGKRFVVAKWWQDYALSLMAEMTDCSGQGEPCSVIPLNSSRIVWFPENPFHPDPEVPDGYTYHPYTVVTGGIIDDIISIWGLGYQIGDVYTDLTKIPLATWLPDFIENLGNLPSFTVPNLEGEGVLKIHLLNIPQGGRALIQIDDAFNPFNLQLVELNKDLVSFPQETQTPIVIEVKVTGTGTHSVKVTFVPTVDDALIPVFFGGGLRQIEVCGFGVTDMPFDPCCPDEVDALQEIVTQNTTLIANITTIVNNLTTVINQGDTNNLNNLIQQFNQYSTINNNYQLLNQLIYDGNPQSIAPNIGDNWNDTGDDLGNGGLCAAIKLYIDACIYNKTNEVVQDAIAEGAVANAIIAAMMAAAVPSAGITAAIGAIVAGVNLAVALSVEAWNESVHDPAAKRKVYCCMYDSLKDVAVSEASIQTSVNDCGFDVGTNESNIAAVINDANQAHDNYLAFLRAMNTNPDTNDAECLCDCDTDIVLEDFAGTGCVITPMGNCIFRFVQPTITHVGENDVYYFSFREIMSRCLLIEDSGDPAHPTAPVGFYTTAVDCEGTETNFTGGFGGEGRSVHWFQGIPNSTTYYKITLAE